VSGKPEVFNPGNRSITPYPLKGRRPSGQARLEDNCRWVSGTTSHALERGINGTCPRPHRKDALAQCRIGFQPVSPNHGTNHRESDLSPQVLQTIYRSRGRPFPGKGSSCGSGDRLEAYPKLLSGASSDDPRLSCVYSRHYPHQTVVKCPNYRPGTKCLGMRPRKDRRCAHFHESDRTLRDGSFGVALSQALRATLRSHRPSGTFRNRL
jgi:hypothetical protein